MKTQPTGHRVIVKPDPLSEVEERELQKYEALKAKGFEVTDAADKKRKEQAILTGTVVAVGPQAFMAFALPIINNRNELLEAGFSAGVITEAYGPWAQVGDKVYFAKYGGFLIEEGGEQYRLLNDEDITAVIREGAA
jgi:co-chaperonin GroES (HSP10)